MPQYKDDDLPVIFTGLDWDASIYGAPYTNTTGMISVALVNQLIEYIREKSNGGRIAWLGYDIFTARKEIQAYKTILGISMDPFFVKSFAEWQAMFLELQDEADMILHSGMLTDLQDWDMNAVIDFVQKNI
jgi:hypothetical protein